MNTRSESSLKRVVLTGGPGGGKTALLNRLCHDPELSRITVATEEAIYGMRFVRLNPQSREFQCALVAIQAATEAVLLRTFQDSTKRILISHRGTLDPCAFWQSFRNSRESFFEMTGTALENHYRRYDLVIHLESAAVRMPEAYVRYPQAHRPEDLQQAARLDQLLAELWSAHPRYVKIEGTRNLEDKLHAGMELIRRELS